MKASSCIFGNRALLSILLLLAFCCAMPIAVIPVRAQDGESTPAVRSDQPDAAEAPSLQAPEGEHPEEEAAYPQVVRPGYAVGKKMDPIPKKKGDCTGEVYIGQRLVTEKHAGWGWIKPERMNWRSARWVMLKETPGVIHIPSRYTGDTHTDNGMQYRLYGYFAPYLGYEPNIDVYVPVFVLKGFELIGRGEPVNRALPAASILNRTGRISERGANLPRSATTFR